MFMIVRIGAKRRINRPIYIIKLIINFRNTVFVIKNSIIRFLLTNCLTNCLRSGKGLGGGGAEVKYCLCPGRHLLPLRHCMPKNIR